MELGKSSIIASRLYGYRGFTEIRPLMADSAAYKAERDDLLVRRKVSSDEADQLMRKKIMEEATMWMAGPVAQHAITGERLQDIWNGDADRTLIERIASSPDEEKTLHTEAAEKAEELLSQKWHLVEAVARGLLAHEELNSEQLREILTGAEEHA